MFPAWVHRVDGIGGDLRVDHVVVNFAKRFVVPDEDRKAEA